MNPLQLMETLCQQSDHPLLHKVRDIERKYYDPRVKPEHMSNFLAMKIVMELTDEELDEYDRIMEQAQNTIHWARVQLEEGLTH